MNAPYIPAKTLQKLNESHPKGTRHQAKKDIAMSLIGNGMSPMAVCAELRSKFPEASDKEIEGVVDWAVSRGPTPSTPKSYQQFTRPSISPPSKPKRSPSEHAAWWLSGKTTTVEAFKEKSQLPIPESRTEALSLSLEMLYQGSENVNVVCNYTEDGGKAKPCGPGRIISRDKWLEYLQEKGVPDSKAGAWVRPNPCKPQGSGSGGAVTDSDIICFRFLLLESDVLPLETQLALFEKIRLPIALVVTSGGASAHAWVRVDAKNQTEYSDIGRRVLSDLAPFGIDQANKNPSRLSRLPEARRVIGAQGTGLQSLLWLNPGKQALTESDLEKFEDSLEIPAIEDKPFREVIIESMARYEDLVKNQGKIGIPTGFTKFDKETGGLHPGQMSVLAGETNAGKSSVAINIINNALHANCGVALFTLEMGSDEIADLLFAMNSEVDRNHFNTGYFEEGEVNRMATKVKWLSSVPLWVFDDSLVTATQIRKRTLALKAENKISLAVVDYAQIITPEGGDNREQQVAHISRILRSTAKDAKVAMLVLSQLNDDGKVRESRVLAHEAHNVFLLDNKENKGTIEFQVQKGRRIQKKDYLLDYSMTYCQVRDHQEAPPQQSNYYQ